MPAPPFDPPLLCRRVDAKLIAGGGLRARPRFFFYIFFPPFFSLSFNSRSRRDLILILILILILNLILSLSLSLSLSSLFSFRLYRLFCLSFIYLLPFVLNTGVGGVGTGSATEISWLRPPLLARRSLRGVRVCETPPKRLSLSFSTTLRGYLVGDRKLVAISNYFLSFSPFLSVRLSHSHNRRRTGIYIWYICIYLALFRVASHRHEDGRN